PRHAVLEKLYRSRVHHRWNIALLPTRVCGGVSGRPIYWQRLPYRRDDHASDWNPGKLVKQSCPLTTNRNLRIHLKHHRVAGMQMNEVSRDKQQARHNKHCRVEPGKADVELFQEWVYHHR